MAALGSGMAEGGCFDHAPVPRGADDVNGYKAVILSL